MAINDIYVVQANFSCPKSAASFRVYYRETTEFTDTTFGTNAITVAVQAQLFTTLAAMISADYRVASFTGRKVFDGREPRWVVDVAGGQGIRLAPGLPANNAAVLGLGQNTFSNRSNGRVFIPGIAEGDSNTGVLSGAFILGVFNDFRDQLVATVSELSPGVGEWQPGIISRKVLNAAPPAKDWAGAFAPIVNGIPQAKIGTQRRRTTPIRGAFL